MTTVILSSGRQLQTRAQKYTAMLSYTETNCYVPHKQILFFLRLKEDALLTAVHLTYLQIVNDNVRYRSSYISLLH